MAELKKQKIKYAEALRKSKFFQLFARNSRTSMLHRIWLQQGHTSFVQEEKMPWCLGGINLEKQIWKTHTAFYSNPEVIT
jgi:hypothetical protein